MPEDAPRAEPDVEPPWRLFGGKIRQVEIDGYTPVTVYD